jgi:hypothetical protein
LFLVAPISDGKKSSRKNTSSSKKREDSRKRDRSVSPVDDNTQRKKPKVVTSKSSSHKTAESVAPIKSKPDVRDEKKVYATKVYCNSKTKSSSIVSRDASFADAAIGMSAFYKQKPTKTATKPSYGGGEESPPATPVKKSKRDSSTSQPDPAFAVPTTPSSGKLVCRLFEIFPKKNSLANKPFSTTHSVRVAATDLSQDATEKTLRRIREQVVLAIKRLPSSSADTHNALVFCTGGSFSTTNLSLFRCWTDRSNYKQFMPKVDHFHGTELQDRVVQVYAKTTLHHPDSSHHLIKCFSSAKSNKVRVFNDRKGGSPRLARGEWPITDYKQTNCFVMGLLLDFHEAWNPEPKSADLAPLMLKWAERFFDQLNELRLHFGADVFFLGTGVANDHEEFGKHIHLFNARLLRLIKEEHVASGSPLYPRLYFHDIYSPDKDEDWTNWSKQVSGRPVGWSDEPATWVARVMNVLVPYLRVQCVSSSNRRVDFEKIQKEHRETSPRERSTSKHRSKSGHRRSSPPRRTSHGRRDDSTKVTHSRQVKVTARASQKPDKPVKRTTSPVALGKANFSRR